MTEEFSNPRLAAIYDLLNPWAADTDFYLSLPRTESSRVLDLGCGTGLLTCAFGQRGHHVVGVDPEPAMLAVARARGGGDRVAWITAEAQTFRSDRRFDLIVMTGHAFQFLLEDRDIRAGLATMRHHLAAGGRVAFETRNPLRRAWTAWTPERTRHTVTSDAGETVTVWTEITGATEDLVHFSMHFRFDDEETVLSSPAALRFLSVDALDAQLAAAGFRVENRYGYWDKTAFEAESPEIITVAKLQ